ncbi:protein kinase domain-containing protein [Fictibacillus barbaricus]|uniref:Serine/threonine-protein kinase n=1 Tax=Fictibacillus barbaricus TaxID=182136 RepID=A0ABU1U5W2_9BACL|nr:protein kinase family protein [Fictibacillus barbaricus]MDR7074869.1 serine/threonine-protein kinase [Fictibacillus barbaricus]
MMPMDMSASPVCNLTVGDEIRGKWNHSIYRVRRRLGYGATGAVYLVEHKNGLAALKIGHDQMSITSEVNVLKRFSKVQGKVLGPSLVEVDDWQTRKATYPFYAMEYLKGETLFDFMKGKSLDWPGILLVQLLTDLHTLHQAGWAFGDLKPDNLLVTGPPYRIRWMDVGGTTVMDRSIKEYTEFFDRGYWGKGSRKAEPSYDLFSAAMVMINMAYPARFTKRSDPDKQLQEKIASSPMLKRYAVILEKALNGKYQYAEEMRNELVVLLNAKDQNKTNQKQMTKSNNQKPATRQAQKKKKKSFLAETFLVFTFVFVVYLFYMLGQTM